MEEEEGGLTAWTYPLEIISVIMTFLIQRGGTGKDIISCMSVCSSWRAACQQGQLWEMMFKRKWRKQYPRLRSDIQSRCNDTQSEQLSHQEIEILKKIKGGKKNDVHAALLPSVRKAENAWMKACKNRVLPKLLFPPGVAQICVWKMPTKILTPKFAVCRLPPRDFQERLLIG